MPAEVLRTTEAARRLGLTTRDVVRLMYERKLRYVLIDGIAHVPVDAIEDYRQRVA